MRSLLRNWREADRTVRLVYAVVGVEIAIAILLLAGCWPGF
jgi:hypothetical protein